MHWVRAWWSMSKGVLFCLVEKGRVDNAESLTVATLGISLRGEAVQDTL